MFQGFYWKPWRSVKVSGNCYDSSRFLETAMKCRGFWGSAYIITVYYLKVKEMKQMETIEFEMSSFRVQNFHLRSSSQQILTWSILSAFSVVVWNSIITPSLDIWWNSLKFPFFGTLLLLKYNLSQTSTETAIEVTFVTTCMLLVLELKTTKKKGSLSHNGFQVFPRSWFGWSLFPTNSIFS